VAIRGNREMKDLDLGVTKMELEFQVRYKYEGYVVE